jgi:glycosyltransferase involved in cell wall biosynthesis
MLKSKKYFYKAVSIIIPVLNEKKNIKKLIFLIKKYLKNFKYEIIFVDDN